MFERSPKCSTECKWKTEFSPGYGRFTETCHVIPAVVEAQMEVCLWHISYACMSVHIYKSRHCRLMHACMQTHPISPFILVIWDTQKQATVCHCKKMYSTGIYVKCKGCTFMEHKSTMTLQKPQRNTGYCCVMLDIQGQQDRRSQRSVEGLLRRLGAGFRQMSGTVMALDEVTCTGNGEARESRGMSREGADWLHSSDGKG